MIILKDSVKVKTKCDHCVGWKIIEDEEIGEELYFPVWESDDITPDEEFNYCCFCGEKL